MDKGMSAASSLLIILFGAIYLPAQIEGLTGVRVTLNLLYTFFVQKILLITLQELQEFRNVSDNIKEFWQGFYNGHLWEFLLTFWSM